jgi:hypothetical protein
MKSYPIFIISQGRDGSTLLQRLLNQIPGFNIFGENWNFLGHLMDINHDINSVNWHLDVKEQFMDRDTYDKYENFNMNFKPSWYNNYKLDEVNLNTAKLIESILHTTDHRVWGCKEIRWGVDHEYTIEFDKDKGQMIRYHSGFKLVSYQTFKRRLDRLRLLFPNCKFIFTSRNLKGHLKSGWWAEFSYKESLATLTTLREYYESYYNSSDNSYKLTYEDIIECNDNYKNLYSFLGEDFLQSSYTKIINKKI